MNKPDIIRALRLCEEHGMTCPACVMREKCKQENYSPLELAARLLEGGGDDGGDRRDKPEGCNQQG